MNEKAGAEIGAGQEGDGMTFDETARMPGHLLRRCQQIAVSIFLQESKALDLTPLQFAALAALAQYGPLDQASLGGLTALDRTTVGVVVKKLETRGLLERKRSNKDRRSMMLVCTPAGRTLVARAAGPARAAQDRILAPLDAAERATLLDLLARVAAANNAESRAPFRG